MRVSPLLIYDLTAFFIILLITVSSLYSAWVNLFMKKISTLGFDAFILLFYKKRNAMMIRGNPQLIKRMGIITLLIGLGGANESISIFIQKVWPYFY